MVNETTPKLESASARVMSLWTMAKEDAKPPQEIMRQSKSCSTYRVYEVGEDSSPNRNCALRPCVPGEAIGKGNVLSVC